MSEDQMRARVVAEARTWIRTPYHTYAMRKGPSGGVDCAMFPIGVYSNLGLIPRLEIERYPPDWYLHRDQERYLNIVLQHAHEVAAPKSADLALWRIGRLFAHGAIVVNWPEIIHADSEARCVIEGRGDGGRLQKRPVRFFSYWEP